MAGTARADAQRIGAGTSSLDASAGVGVVGSTAWNGAPVSGPRPALNGQLRVQWWLRPEAGVILDAGGAVRALPSGPSGGAVDGTVSTVAIGAAWRPLARWQGIDAPHRATTLTAWVSAGWLWLNGVQRSVCTEAAGTGSGVCFREGIGDGTPAISLGLRTEPFPGPHQTVGFFVEPVLRMYAPPIRGADRAGVVVDALVNVGARVTLRSHSNP
jgi:hypothetical protein